jgi:hypothetical protein
MTKLEREIERDLVDLFQSFGRGSVYDASGEPTIDYVRSFEPASEDGTIFDAGLNSLSLTFLARQLANKFGSASP